MHLMPWSRRFGGKIGMLKFRARVCIEGVPPHVRQAETVAQLFSGPLFVDEVDDRIEKEAEKWCFTI
jgi:hypothetical protein